MSNATQSVAAARINSLLDANSFVEIGQAVTARATDFNMTEKKAPSDGVITGYGVIDGSLVYVYSQDASVLNGTVGEMHAKKITKIYDLALKVGAPVIGLVDCAGLRLQEATDALEAFGEIYLKQTLASGVIPQITAVFGTCGGGMAVVPALTDFTFVEEKKGRLFVNTPNALEGNRVEKCDSASAQFQSEETGLVDGIGTEEEILGQIRTLVSMLPENNEDNDSFKECTDDLNRVCDDIAGCTGDTAIAGTQPTSKTDKPQFRLESYFGRVNLTLANKYLITGSIRRDASSKFSKALSPVYLMQSQSSFIRNKYFASFSPAFTLLPVSFFSYSGTSHDPLSRLLPAYHHFHDYHDSNGKRMTTE